MRAWSSLVIFLAAGCALAAHNGALDNDEPGTEAASSNDYESAPTASPRLPAGDFQDLGARIDSYFEGFGTKRVHVQLDRPMYRPGETVWLKSWSVVTRGLEPDAQSAITYELLDPQGQVVETKRTAQRGGTANNDFELGADAPGGQWTLRATTPTGEVDERPFVVSSYAAPRIRKELEFVREAYGAGERVEALVELEHGTGGPLANHPVRALLQVDGRTVAEQTLTTDKTGAVLVAAVLPAKLTTSDGLLTVLVEEGGITESISRPVPIVLADVQLAFFPEGGDLVNGLPGRVYFSAENRHGEPADVQGYVTDDLGRKVTAFSSVHDGLGRLAFTPQGGRTYTAHVTTPVGITSPFALPEAHAGGCTLRSFDDARSVNDDVRVAVRCSKDQQVIVAGVQREHALDSAVVDAGPSRDTVVYLHPDASQSDAQGAVQVTVFDRDREPLAERLVYRNHGKNLKIDVTPAREQYGPRDQVVLTVKTATPSGEPIAAELALSVVDDAVLGLADDKEGHMLSRLYLEPELVDSPKDPAFYFDADEALAAQAMDLVMGTGGHRRFEWRMVWAPPPIAEPQVQLDTGIVLDAAAWVDDDGEGEAVAEDHREGLKLPRLRAFALPPAAVAAPAGAPVVDVAMLHADGKAKDAAGAFDLDVRDLPVQRAAGLAGRGERPKLILEEAKREAWGGELDAPLLDRDQNFRGGGRRMSLATVRVFPAPDYAAGLGGVRSDFRDTVHWEPNVTTDATGTGEVRFYLSDAVTNFRVTTEGLGAGVAGHDEITLSSVLPVSIATRLPPAVSAGDRIVLPLTVTSTRDASLSVGVASTFGSDAMVSTAPDGTLTLAPRATETFWVPVEVKEGNEDVTIRLSAEGGGLSDTIERQLTIVPSGFPRSWSASGESDEVHRFAFQLDAVVAKSLSATVTWHPSSVSTLISGMEGMISTPGGCFEQTSSTNWPNVAILNYLEAHDGDPRLKVQSNQALRAGYEKLTGYQVGAGGFETWGSGPGKEALSAFGLLQFHDMKKVFPVADAVLSKDADYLLAQRNGKGGFKNSGESAHGYGSAPPAILDGFITYALVETGHAGSLDAEIAQQAGTASKSVDPYVLALAVRSLQGAAHPAAAAAATKLAGLQAADGSFPGAESSITRSYEANLVVESTALAALALMDAGGHRAAADKAADWLIANRQGGGTWGATQATALALSALARHADVSRVPQTAGVLSIEVNGEIVDRVSYEADQREALTIEGWERFLVTGQNTVVLRQEQGAPLPFTVDVNWTSISPTSAPDAELALTTRLDRSEASLGDTVRLTAKVTNRVDRIVPSPIARIGLPAGLEAQVWQLKQLQERGEIAFYETRPREVTLYWDGVHAQGSHEVKLDLVAVVPGSFTAPASSAYPYYDDTDKAWNPGVKVAIAR